MKMIHVQRFLKVCAFGIVALTFASCGSTSTTRSVSSDDYVKARGHESFSLQRGLD
jgi:hypothetical protein